MSVSSPLMRKLSSASKLPLTAEAVRVAAVSKRWQPNLQGRMFFCMLMSSKLSLFFTNFYLTLFVSHYHIVVTFINIYWYLFFLHFYEWNWCWYVFLFCWPVDHAPSVSVKPKQVVNLLQSAVWLVSSAPKHSPLPVVALKHWHIHRVMNCWWHNGSVWFLVVAEVAVFISDHFKSS